MLTVAKGGPKFKESNGVNVSEPDLKPGMLRLNPRSGSLAGTELDIPYLVQTLSDIMDQTVLNKTALDGKYDFALKWSPDPTVSADAPGIFTALQEQLGLKLESSKGQVEVVVIDSVETPSEN